MTCSLATMFPVDTANSIGNYIADIDGNKYNKITIDQFNTQKNADMNNPNYEENDNTETAIQCREEIKFGEKGSLNLFIAQHRGFNEKQRKLFDAPYVFFLKFHGGRRERFSFPLKYANIFYKKLGEMLNYQQGYVTFIDEEYE